MLKNSYGNGFHSRYLYSQSCLKQSVKVHSENTFKVGWLLNTSQFTTKMNIEDDKILPFKDTWLRNWGDHFNRFDFNCFEQSFWYIRFNIFVVISDSAALRLLFRIFSKDMWCNVESRCRPQSMFATDGHRPIGTAVVSVIWNLMEPTSEWRCCRVSCPIKQPYLCQVKLQK